METFVDQSAPVHEVAHALLDQFDPTRVIVVEDVHWADAATLDVVRLTCRRLARTRGLLIVTYRDDQIGRTDPLRVLLGEISTMAGISRLHVDPLSEEAVAVLAAHSGLDAAALHHQTRGNAFFVTEVLAAGATVIPPTVSDAVLARAARLTTGGRRLIDALAVLTAPADAALVEAVAGDDSTCMEECCANGLLVEADTPVGSITFRHELARRALEQALPAPTRTRLHGRALAVLSSTPAGDPATLAHHAVCAGDGSAVYVHSRAAGVRAAHSGAHAEAVTYLRTAVGHAPQLPPAEAASLFGGLAYEAYLLDLSAEAVVNQRRAVEALARAGDVRAEGAALATLSRMQWLDADLAGAFASVERAIALLEPLPPGAELAAAYGQRCALGMLSGDRVAAVAWARRALAIAEPVGALDIQSDVLNSVGCAEWCVGDERGREMLLRSLEIALEIDDLEAVGRAYANLAEEATLHMRQREARRYIEDGLAFSKSRGLTRTRVCLESAMAALLLAEARFDEAGECLGFLESSPSVSAVTRLDALTHLGLLRARRGDPGAWEAIDAATTAAAQFAQRDRIGWAQLAEIEASYLDEDLLHARSVTEHALAGALRDSDPECDRFAWWAQRLGLPAACPQNARPPFATVLAGDHVAAADQFGVLGWRYEQALALFDAGDTVSLRRALQILQDIGAKPLARLVKQRLRSSGDGPVPRGPRPTTLANPARLTAREIEVLGLMGDDRSNREIAAELVVSVRTVEHHVAAVLAKLDVTCRRDAVTRAMDLGLLESA